MDKVNDLIISNAAGVSLAGKVDVYNSLTYGVNNGTLNTNGNLTLKSTADNTAWIGDMTNHNINGDVTAPTRRNFWRSDHPGSSVVLRRRPYV